MLSNQMSKTIQYYWLLGWLQVVHSMEETYAQLYLKLDSMIAELHQLFSWFPLVEISADVFGIFNYLMIALILGTVPVAEKNKPLGIVLMWIWAIIELLNGTFHIGTWILLHAYFPGGFSGPTLFIFSVLFIQRLRATSTQTAQATQ